MKALSLGKIDAARENILIPDSVGEILLGISSMSRIGLILDSAEDIPLC